MGVASRVWAGLAVPISLLGTLAQAAEPLTAGAVSDTLKRPPELKVPEPTPPPLTLPRSSTLEAGKEGGTLITVRQFEFIGNTVFPEAELQAVVASYLVRPIGRAELYEAADRVTDYYLSRGYSLAAVVVPAQKINQGTVRLEVIEGRVDGIAYQGLNSYRKSLLDDQLGGVRGQIYRSGPFENGLRDLNELPGLDVRATLRPSEQYGGTDIQVEAQENRLEGVAFVDNHGRDSIGQGRVGTQLTINNPGRIGDRLQLLGLRSSQLRYGSLSYSIPTRWQRSILSLSYGYADFDLEGAPVDGNNRVARAGLDFPWLKDQQQQLALSAAVTNTQADTSFAGIPIPGQATSLTLLEMGASWSRSGDDRSLSQLNLGLSSNFSVANSNGADERNDQRLRLEADVQHLRPLHPTTQILAHVNAVYSPDPLPDTQQLSIGGPSSIRGFVPSEARGDYGYYAQLSLRQTFKLGRWNWAARVFGDTGAVYSHSPGLGSNSLSSVGLGLDAGINPVSLTLDWATPIDSKPISDGRDDGRLYGALTVNFD